MTDIMTDDVTLLDVKEDGSFKLSPDDAAKLLCREYIGSKNLLERRWRAGEITKEQYHQFKREYDIRLKVVRSMLRYIKGY